MGERVKIDPKLLRLSPGKARRSNGGKISRVKWEQTGEAGGLVSWGGVCEQEWREPRG